jgi:Putative bacterial sensory transduction regulator
MAMYREVTIPQLRQITSSVSAVFDVQDSGDAVICKYKDKDQDAVLVIVDELDDERVVAMMPLRVPQDRTLATLVAVNNWNQRKDAHGTFAYMANIGDDPYAIIEANLLLKGGADEDNIRSWVKNLVNHINPFEEQIISTLQEIGEDSDLLKSGEQGDWWNVIGQVAGTAFDAWLSS